MAKVTVTTPQGFPMLRDGEILILDTTEQAQAYLGSLGLTPDKAGEYTIEVDND